MTLLPILLVALVLVFAIVRPRGLPEIVIAGPAAVVVLLTGVVTLDEARDELASMAPTVVFLVAVLVLAHAADALGVFRWVSQILQQKSLADPHRLLIYVFGAAALTTAVLSLDGHRRAADTRGDRGRTMHRSKSPAAFLCQCAPVEFGVDPAAGVQPDQPHRVCRNRFDVLALHRIDGVAVGRDDRCRVPDFSTVLPFGTRAGRQRRTAGGSQICACADSAADGDRNDAARFSRFRVSSGSSPSWIAVVGASVLGAIALARHRTTAAKMLYAADLWFCAFVLVLGIIVAGVANGPVGEWIAQILPGDTSYGSLLFVAAVAAVASNLVNNLPATLLMIAALGTAAPPALVLAMLIGVNLGPNLTYVGSLATMLWRRVATSAGAPPTLATFTLLGVITTPLTLLAAVSALWLVI